METVLLTIACSVALVLGFAISRKHNKTIEELIKTVGDSAITIALVDLKKQLLKLKVDIINSDPPFRDEKERLDKIEEELKKIDSRLYK